METKFIASYRYIFKEYFSASLVVLILLLLTIIPIGDLYYQRNNLTISSTTTTLLLIPILIFLPIFIKNNSILTVNIHSISIKYPFSTRKKIYNLLWGDILTIEKDSKNKVIYIIKKNHEKYALDQKLWYRSFKNSTMTNLSLEESDLYKAISHYFSISETSTIDYNTYKNNFSAFYGNRFAITFLPILIIASITFYNIYDFKSLATRNSIVVLNLCFLWSFFGLFIFSLIKNKDIRFINASFTKSIIYSIYLMCIIICSTHQYSIYHTPTQNLTYTLQESSDYRQTWIAEENAPNIILYSHSYPQHRFLYEKIGTQHNFRMIHGVLDSYDIVNSDIEAILSPK